jgi:hypothetical protein
LAPLKSTGHRNIETGSEEVEEDPMVTERAQEQQQRMMVEVRENQRHEQVKQFLYWIAYYTIVKGDEEESAK